MRRKRLLELLEKILKAIEELKAEIETAETQDESDPPPGNGGTPPPPPKP